MTRTAFLVDGFNLYHSLRAAGAALGGASTKWLDLRALCASYLHLVGEEAILERVYYFSALATHLESLKPDLTQRHRILIDALEANGVAVQLGRFKAKTTKCRNCGEISIRHEEKETDVAIGTKLLELLYTRQCEAVIIVSGDTDLAPAVRTAVRLFAGANVAFAFPYARKSGELARLSRRSFTISKEAYRRHQFADPLVLADGRILRKPPAW